MSNTKLEVVGGWGGGVSKKKGTTNTEAKWGGKDRREANKNRKSGRQND